MSPATTANFISSASARIQKVTGGIASTITACISSASSTSWTSANGLGSLGREQLEWLENDLKGRSCETPIVVFAHIPLWEVYPQWAGHE